METDHRALDRPIVVAFYGGKDGRDRAQWASALAALRDVAPPGIPWLFSKAEFGAIALIPIASRSRVRYRTHPLGRDAITHLCDRRVMPAS
jgi:hypothetical protein